MKYTTKVASCFVWKHTIWQCVCIVFLINEEFLGFQAAAFLRLKLDEGKVPKGVRTVLGVLLASISEMVEIVQYNSIE